ncbi:unnamed protein product [Candida verbasci]|uniref:Homeobox domain-containing protein n=1 Tax=Candida verbasci TaxID=1227364 RepID=A0A9W4X8E7_9ASCO|nr:unnamed protein product [Candida verbasci]
MNSELYDCHSLLQSLATLEDITSQFLDDETNHLYHCSQKNIDELNDLINNIGKHPLLEAEYYVDSQMKVLHETNKRATKFTTERAIVSSATNENDLCINEMTISISNKLNDNFLSMDVSSAAEKLSEEAAVESSNKTKKRRRRLDKAATTILEKVFATCPTPNRREREFIAQKCGVEPLQVRVWFTNKRMRAKQSKKKLEELEKFTVTLPGPIAEQSATSFQLD